MREGWPSLTALAVAVGRGIGTSMASRDPSAPALVPTPLSHALRWVGRAQTPAAVRHALRVATLGMVDHVTLRSAAIDAALQDAIGAGATQLVVLGAGLDGRAWRLPALRNVVVFEVDHPATQAGKRRRVEHQTPCAAEVRFVAVDFERDALDTRLQQVGHDPNQPTAWIWEGVTPYLQPSAIESTLRDVARRSAASSRLLVSYAVPELTVLRSPAVARAVQAGFATLGEPLHGAIDSEALADQLADHGFVVLHDSNNVEWANTHGGSALMPRAFWAERLMVAEATARD